MSTLEVIEVPQTPEEALEEINYQFQKLKESTLAEIEAAGFKGFVKGAMIGALCALAGYIGTQAYLKSKIEIQPVEEVIL